MGGGQSRVARNNTQTGIQGYNKQPQPNFPSKLEQKRSSELPQQISSQTPSQIPQLVEPQNQLVTSYVEQPKSKLKVKSNYPLKPFPFDGPQCVEDELALRIQKQFKDFSTFLDDTNRTLGRILSNEEKKKGSEVY